MKAAGLIRVSDPTKAEKGYSLDDQERMIQEHCAAAGDDLVEIVVEAGVSGKFVERRAYTRLEELFLAGVQKLVYVRFDRLSRKGWKGLQLLDQWRERGLTVLCLERPHSTGATAADRFMDYVDAGVAELEWERVRQKTMGGRARKAAGDPARGIVGRIPQSFNLFGYDVVQTWEEKAGLVPEGTSGTLRVRESEAAVVRLIFQAYDGGESVRGLALRLDAEGLRTRTGCRWSPQAIRRVIQQTAYVGELVYGRTEWKHVEVPGTDRKRKEVRRHKAPEEWHRIPCPPLVDRELFERCQRRLSDRAEVMPGRPTTVWPLRGVVFCGHCVTRDGPKRAQGTRATRNSRHQSYHLRHYRCYGCNLKRSAERLESRAWEVLKQETETGRLGEVCRRKAEARARASGDVEARIAGYEAEVRRLDDEERGIARMIAAGISPHIVAEQVAVLQAKRTAAQLALQQALRQSAEQVAPETAYRTGEEMAETIRAEIAAAQDSRELRQSLFSRFIRVTIRRSGSEVRCIAAERLGL